MCSDLRFYQSRPLSSLVPILFPFFRHTIPNVRLAVVKTLHNFLSVPHLPDDWIAEPVLRLLFQNLIMEERLDTQTVTLKAWRAALSRLQGLQSRLLHVISPLIRDWFTILMTPLGVAIQTSLLYQHMPVGAEDGHNVDKNMIAQDLSLVPPETIIRARVAGSQALSIVLSCWPIQEQSDAFGVPLEFYQESTSMLQQFLAATIVREWANEFCAQSRPRPTQSLRATSPLADNMIQRFFAYLQADPPTSYYEMYLNLSHISSSCHALLDMFQRDAKVPPSKIPALPTTIDTNGTIEGAFSIDMARSIIGSTFEELRSQVTKARRKELPAIDIKQREIAASISQYGEIKEQHDARVSAAIAGALIALREMPPKLNPVIRSVMNGVKVGWLADSLSTTCTKPNEIFTSLRKTSIFNFVLRAPLQRSPLFPLPLAPHAQWLQTRSSRTWEPFYVKTRIMRRYSKSGGLKWKVSQLLGKTRS